MSPASKDVAGGVAYTLAANYAVRFVNLAITIVVARAVGPAGMGVVAAALLTVEIIDTIRDFGLREALIYEPALDEGYSNSAFLVIQAISLLQAVAMISVGWFGSFFGIDPLLANILIWLGILFPLNALGSPQEAMLQRRGAFGRRALADLVSVIVKAAVAVTLVWLGWGVWSIVAGMLLGIAARSAVLWLQSDWRPRLVLPKPAAVLALVQYGKHIIAVNIMALCRLKADQFVVAAVLGPSALGAYFLAARIPEIAIFSVNVAITTVAFPSFSRIVRENGPLPEIYLRTVRAAMLLMVPVSVGIAATSGQIVAVFFGPDWTASIPVLATLALGGIPLTLGWSSGDVFKATGRPQLLTTVTLIEVLVASPIVAAVVVTTQNLAWISATMVACETAACALRLVFMSRYGATGIRRTLIAVAPILLAASVMGIVVHVAGQQLIQLAPAARLAVSVLIGIVTYLALVLLIDRASVAEVRQLLRNRAGGVVSPGLG